MGIQINGQTDTITAIDGQMTISGTDLSTNTLDLSTINATGVSTFAGNIDANGDLDVDGHTELDAVNVSGFLTATSAYYSGDVTVLGTLTYEDVTNVDVVGIATARAGLRINGGGLYVTGVSTFNGDLSITDKIVHEGDTDTAIRFPANDTFTVETAGSERLRVTSGGYAGIGTDNPTKKLTVYGSDTELVRLTQAVDSGTQQEFGIGFAANLSHTHPAAQITYEEFDASDSRGNLLFYTRGDNSDSAPTERLRIDSSGNVGINTSTPAAKLNVVTTSTDDAILMLEADMGTNNNRVLQFKSPATDSGADPFLIQTGNSIQFRIDSTDALKINDNGNIGIGTDNPDEKLEVYGGNIQQYNENASGGTGLILHNYAAGGGGNTLPYSFIRAKSNPIRNAGEIRFGRDSAYGSAAEADSHISFWTAKDDTNTERLRITASGNIGIGTDIPAGKFQVFNTQVSNSVTIDTAGRILIGRTTNLASSSEKLTLDSGMVIFRNNSTTTAPLYLRNDDSTASTRHPYLTLSDSSGNRGGIGVQNDDSSLWICGQTGIRFRGGTSSPGNTEWMRIGSSGQLGFGGANYGTSGQVLTSQGSGSAPQWATPAGGKILQVVSVRKTDAFSTSSSTYVTITGLTATITPSSASNKILITYSLACGGRNSDNSGTYIRLYRGGTPPHIGDQAGSSRERATMAINNQGANVDFYTGHFLDSPNTTNSITYEMKIRKRDSVTVYINQENGQNDADSIYYGRYPSTITLMEVEA